MVRRTPLFSSGSTLTTTPEVFWAASDPLRASFDSWPAARPATASTAQAGARHRLRFSLIGRPPGEDGRPLNGDVRPYRLATPGPGRSDRRPRPRGGPSRGGAGVGRPTPDRGPDSG